MRKTNMFVFFLTGFVVLLSLIGTNPAFAWQGVIEASVGTPPDDSPGGGLTFGVEACTTDCTDTTTSLPGQTIWLYDSPPGTTRYIKQINSNTALTSYMWVMRIVVALDPVSINWDFSSLPAGTFVLKSGQDGNGTTVVADMRTIKTYTEATGGYFTIHYTPSGGTAPTVTTTSPATNITQTGATVDGNVTSEGSASVTARGICVGTTANPTTGCTAAATAGAGTFSVALSGLTANTGYFARAFATSTVGTSYGADVQFTTAAGPSVPTVTTTAASAIAATTATSGGNVTADGGSSVTARGVCVSTTADPAVGGNCTSDGTGTGSFISNLTGLTPSTLYHYRAYATNTTGTGYGSDLTFTTTCTPPTITANPTAATDPAVGVEAGTAVTFTGSASGDWKFGDGGTENGTAAPAAHTYVNAGSYTVTLTVGGCSATAKVTVVPKDCSTKVNSAFTATANGLDVTVAVSGTALGTYSVTFGDGTAAVTTLPHTHTYAAAGIYTITVTSTDAASGCTSTSSQQVTESCAAANKPAITIPTAPITGTAGTAIDFTASGAVDWNFGDGGTAANTATASHTYNNAGNYDVTITNPTSKCSSTTTVKITSSCDAGDMAKISLSTGSPEEGKPYPIGNGTAVPVGTFTSASQVVWKITNLATGVTADPTTPGTADPFSISHTFPSAGDYLVSLTTTVGTCTSTDTKTVTVTPAKKKSVILANDKTAVPVVKPGDAVTFTNQNGSFFEFSSWAITAPNAADNFTLDTPDAITYTFATAGTYTVALSGIGGTGDTAAATPMTIIVSSQTVVSVTPNTAAAGTTGVVIATTGFTSTFTVGGVAVNFGTTAASVTAVDDAAKTVTVTVPAGSGTVDVKVTSGAETAMKTGAFTYSRSITSVTPSTALAGTTGVVIATSGFTSTFTVGGVAVNFGTTAASVTAVDDAAKTVTVTVPAGTGTVDITVTSGTETATKQHAFIYGTPQAPTVQSSAGGTVYAGMASALKITGTNLPANPKVYAAKAPGNCPTLGVNDTPDNNNFTLVDDPASPKTGDTITTTKTPTFNPAGNYCIFVCDANGKNCVPTTLPVAPVDPCANGACGGGGGGVVVPSFGIDSITGNGSAAQITGIVEFTVKFASTSNGAFSYLWDFGDGETSTEAQPTHVYKKAGLYTVKLTISGFLGIGSATKELKDFVKVVAPPTAKFSVTPTSGNSPLTVTCVAEAFTGATKYAWDFGDNQTAEGQNVSHTFMSAGTFTIVLTITYDDAALTRALKTTTATATVVVTPVLTCDMVTSSFTANPMTGNRPLTVNFDASASANADGYSWNFGDNQTGSGKNVSHTFAAAGTYTVTLKTSNSALAGCEKSATQTITVSEKPCEVTAVFTASKLTGDAPLIVNFDATASMKATSFAWAFGDGETGSGVTATHTYTKAGNYTVTLTAKDDVCTKTATQIVQAMATDRPAKPILLSPENGVTTRVPLTPTLKTQTTYSSPVNSPHAKTRWQIATDADFKNVVYDVTNATNLTSIWVPDFMLMEDTKYFWRAQFIDNRGYASDWASPFTMLTVQINPEDMNGNGVPEAQELTDAKSDIDANGVADMKQTDAIFVKMGAKGASGVKTTSANFAGWLKYIDMKTLPTAPAGYDFPWGAMTFRVETKNVGDSAVLTIYFSEALPTGAKWFNYNQIEGWKDYSQYAVFSADRKVVTVTLKDGGLGDADGVANAAIVDPAAIGVPTTAPAPDVCLDCDSGGGGCFISTVSGAGVNAASAAMLTLLTVTSIFFGRRRK